MKYFNWHFSDGVELGPWLGRFWRSITLRCGISRKLHKDIKGQRLFEGACLSSISDAIMVTEAKRAHGFTQRIVFVNQAFLDRTGFRFSEVLGRDPSLLQGPLTQPEELARIRHAVKQGSEVRCELINYNKAKLAHWVQLDIKPIVDTSGSIIYWIGISRDISVRKHAEQRALYLANHDQLTTLFNRQFLQSRLAHALDDSQCQMDFGSLTHISIDKFSELNDTRGHRMGDELLCQVALRLKQLVHAPHCVARIGGDEFGLLLLKLGPNLRVAQAQAESTVDQLRSALTEVYNLRGVNYQAGMSFGLATFKGDTHSSEDVLRGAGIALDRARQSGGNAIRVFENSMYAELLARTELEFDLNQALSSHFESNGRKHFQVFYQTIVDSHRKVIGMEALLRWQHPHRGYVSPVKFIPVAERCGAIVPLGLWVLRTTCAQLAELATNFATQHLTIAVNVSAVQFRRETFVRDLLDILAASGASSSRLRLELTESVLLQDIEATIAKMDELRSHGFDFSLDDFGTGFSSLSYVKRLPLSVLKIDRSFVRDVLVDANSAVIAKSLLALGNSLGLDVIAEGVETQGQFDFLVDCGCQAFQGYLFDQPAPLLPPIESLGRPVNVSTTPSAIPSGRAARPSRSRSCPVFDVPP